MSVTKIKINAVKGLSSKAENAKGKVRLAHSSISGTKNSIDSKIKSRNSLNSRMGKIQRDLSDVEAKINKIDNTVQRCADKYATTDRRVNSRADKIDSVKKKSAQNTMATFNLIYEEVKKTTKKKVDEIWDYYSGEIKKEMEKRKFIHQNWYRLPTGRADLRRFNDTEEFLNGRSSFWDPILFGLSRDWFEATLDVFRKSYGHDDMNDKAYKDSIKTLVESTRYNSKVCDVGMWIVDKGVGGVCSYNEFVEMIDNSSDDLKSLKNLKKIDAEAFDRLGKIASYGETGVEIVEIIFTDYAETIESLEQMKKGLQAVSGNQEIINYIDEIIYEYDNKVCTVAEVTLSKVMEEGAEAGLGYVSTLGTGGLLAFAVEAQGLVFELTGATAKGDQLASIYASDKYSSDLIRSYEYYFNKVKSGDYTQEDVRMCEYMFDLAKTAKINEYTTIKNEFSTDDAAGDLREKIDELEEMNCYTYTE